VADVTENFENGFEKYGGEDTRYYTKFGNSKANNNNNHNINSVEINLLNTTTENLSKNTQDNFSKNYFVTTRENNETEK
jgi:hypothetical protein